MNSGQREMVLKVLSHLACAAEGLDVLVENFKREEAYKAIEEAHQAVALLLIAR